MESKLAEGSHCLLLAEFLNPYSEFQLWRTGADYKEGPISPLLLNPQLICWLFKSSPIVKYLGGDEKSSDYKLGQLHQFIPFLCNPRHICKWRFSFTFWKMGQYLPWACHGWSCNSSIIQTLWFPITTFTVSKELNIVTKQKTYCHSAQFSITNIWGSERRMRLSKGEVTIHILLPTVCLIHLVSITSSWRPKTGSKDEDPHTVCDMDFLAVWPGTSDFNTLCLHLLIRKWR